MSLSLKITVTGGAELKRILNSKKEKVNDRLIDAIDRGAINIENEAKRYAPVVTGYLRANITHEIETIKSIAQAIRIFGRIGVRDIVDYAEAVEVKGTKGTAQPRKAGKKMPYLLPAYNKFIKQIRKDIEIAVVAGMNA